ncbi:glycosyltransferase [Actinosynnema sp. NPDC047251]|uniref:Glycosyltransferase, family 1 n=1 Tax=Saccharothrix espanaensis (strain ATCC 51144 / DSM 44229 / JCM 9112 / NBRC 15066 / NRRL 15764) TaxID=1179773 RepID=K0JWI4_SACES|nr:glycosyltransferase [Saccharothrix espanaensis]CCH32190.1 Glycosyltransferase, family 1 [Saccharothrix espanaensis DSM 44229]
MRILFSSLGSYGHTFPLLPLAIAAREVGHDVTFVTTAPFAGAVTTYGIDHVAGGMDMLAAFELANAGPAARKAPDFRPERVSRVFGSILPRSCAADLGPIIVDRKPDLVVHELANPGAGLAAKVADIPAVCHSFGRRWRPTGPPEAMRANLAEVAADLGVDLSDGDLMSLGNPYLDICPPSVQDPEFPIPPADTIPLRPVPFSEPGELPSWVREHRDPLVYLTLGTAFGDAGVLRTAIAGLATVGAKVFVSTGPSVTVRALGDVPDNVVVRPWLPQADLLPHVDLVVHHGGAGATMGTFATGVPHLVLPQGADQFSNADVVTAAGLGDQVLAADLTAELIATKARRLLTDDAVLAAAKAMAEEVATLPSPHDVARLLPDYA